LKYSTLTTEQTSSSAIAERPHCRVPKLWLKVKDDILQSLSSTTVT